MYCRAPQYECDESFAVSWSSVVRDLGYRPMAWNEAEAHEYIEEHVVPGWSSACVRNKQYGGIAVADRGGVAVVSIEPAPPGSNSAHPFVATIAPLPWMYLDRQSWAMTRALRRLLRSAGCKKVRR